MHAPISQESSRVLILGAEGMLGQAINREWQDWRPVPFNRARLDITNRREVEAVFDALHPHLVINCAAYTAVDQCESEEALAEEVNGTAVGYLARTAAKHEATLIHFSTDYVFDGRSEGGYDEAAATNPVSAYGRTKALGEYELQRSRCRSYLIRTAWLYGPGGPNFVDTIIKLGRTKPTIKVVNDQHGTPTFTRDLARFTRQLIEGNYAPGIYHGVNTGRATWYDVAIEAYVQAGLQTPIWSCTTAEFPRPARRPEWSVLLNTKGPATRQWPEALSEYLATPASRAS